jgi:APA family basic amino acid/polyamine antiporter
LAAPDVGGAPVAGGPRQFSLPVVEYVVAAGAMTAMLGVLLNLLLGLSRVLLAMGRRGDMPRVVATLDRECTTPYVAVLVVAAAVAALVLVGSVRLAWTFSAFTVLVYYGVTNLAALRLPKSDRMFSPLYAWIGLASCLLLAFCVPWQVGATGLAMIFTGLLFHAIARWRRQPSR